MSLFIAYLRLLLFFAAALVGVQVPAFVDQYGQALEARYQESGRNLAAFQRDADRYFGGDMVRLIEHYRRSGDPVFHDGGDSIQALHHRHGALGEALTAFRQGPLQAYWQALMAPAADVRTQAWRSYSYAIQLSPTAIALGAAVGMLVALMGEAMVRGCHGLACALRRRLGPTHSGGPADEPDR